MKGLVVTKVVVDVDLVVVSGGAVGCAVGFSEGAFPVLSLHVIN